MRPMMLCQPSHMAQVSAAQSAQRVSPAISGHEAVLSFTRPPEVAAYWALLERDYDEGRGPEFGLF